MTMLARLLSVNVGLPKDIAWRGKTVHTGIWKEPVQGRRIARRLNSRPGQFVGATAPCSWARGLLMCTSFTERPTCST
jgi:hypothetical protein